MRSQQERMQQSAGFERKGRAGSGKTMNEKQLFCFCQLTCVSKEIFKVNTEVTRACKRRFIIYYTSSLVSAFLNLRN
jgi:hypothetical protein